MYPPRVFFHFVFFLVECSLLGITGIPPNVTYIEPLANLDLTATLARRRRVHYADPPAASSHSQCTAAIRDALSAPKQDLPSSAASDITPLTSSRDHRERRDSSATTVGVEQNGGDCSGQTPQSPYISGTNKKFLRARKLLSIHYGWDIIHIHTDRERRFSDTRLVRYILFSR